MPIPTPKKNRSELEARYRTLISRALAAAEKKDVDSTKQLFNQLIMVRADLFSLEIKELQDEHEHNKLLPAQLLELERRKKELAKQLEEEMMKTSLALDALLKE